MSGLSHSQRAQAEESCYFNILIKINSGWRESNFHQHNKSTQQKTYVFLSETDLNRKFDFGSEIDQAPAFSFSFNLFVLRK